MIDPAIGDKFLVWLRNEALPRLSESGVENDALRLMEVVEVPGAQSMDGQAMSVSLQTDVATLQAAHHYSEVILTPVIEAGTSRFGEENMMTFSTILKKLPI